nr:hypothetical protein [Tanacetum cinerariifolium]
YITESEPEIEPEEEDRDDEKSEEDSIEYSTSGGDDDADNDGDDLLEDDVDDEDEEESSDSEEEEEEYLALTAPAPALYSFVFASEETEPFEEGETAATPPPFGYRVAARIYVQPHILMPFRSESEVERLLATPTPQLSLVSPTSYPLPPFLMPLPIFTPLPTSSFPLPSSLPFTSGSESIPKADIPLRKRARFTTPTGGYETEEREAIFSHLVHHLCIGGVSLTWWNSHVKTVTLEVAQALPWKTLKKMMTENCTAACQVKYAICTLQGVSLTWWNSHVKTVTLEVAQALPWKTLKKMMTEKYCPMGKIKKLETEMWELKTKGTDVIGYSRRFQELALMCDRTFLEESDRVEKYIDGVPDTIHDSVKATKPKTMQKAIEFATKLMDKRIRDAVENKRKFKGTSRNNPN